MTSPTFSMAPLINKDRDNPHVGKLCFYSFKGVWEIVGKNKALTYTYTCYSYLFPKHPLTLLCIDLGQTTQANHYAIYILA